MFTNLDLFLLDCFVCPISFIFADKDNDRLIANILFIAQDLTEQTEILQFFLGNFTFCILFLAMICYWIDTAFAEFSLTIPFSLTPFLNARSGWVWDIKSMPGLGSQAPSLQPKDIQQTTPHKNSIFWDRLKRMSLQLDAFLTLENVANIFMLITNISLVLLLFLRWKTSGHFPLSNLYESLIFLCWCCTSIHIVVVLTITKTFFNKSTPTLFGLATTGEVPCNAFVSSSKDRELYERMPQNNAFLKVKNQKGIKSTEATEEEDMTLKNMSFFSSVTSLPVVSDRLTVFLASSEIPTEGQESRKLGTREKNEERMTLSFCSQSDFTNKSETVPASHASQPKIREFSKVRNTDLYFVKLLGSITAPCALFTNAYATFSLPKEMQTAGPLVPALQSNWLMMHVTVMILSYSALILGALFSIAFLIVTQSFSFNLKFADLPLAKLFKKENVSPASWLRFFFLFLVSALASLGFRSTEEPQQKNVKDAELSQKEAISVSNKNTNVAKEKLAKNLDNLSYRILGIGFPFLTIGILSGAVWANEAWGSYWSWDPKETWAFLTWLVFAIYLHMRLSHGWEGKKPALMASFGFLIVWFCFLGVNLLGEGLHSYGWILN